MGFFQKIVLLLNILFGGLLALAFISPSVDPSLSVIPSVLGAIFPFLLMIHIGFIIYWVLNNWAWSLLSIILLTLGWKHLYSFCGFNRAVTIEKSISVSTFNTFGLREHKLAKDQNKKKIEGELKQIFQKDHNIICLQEVNSHVNKVLKSYLNPNSFSYSKEGVKLISKYPILDKGSFDFHSTINSCIWIDVEIKKEPVRVYCMHLKSNRVSIKANEIVKDGDLYERETWSNLRTMMSRYKTGAVSRKEQSNIIKTHSVASDKATILCGDLNDHPLSYTYHSLTENLKDSFVERGKGIGTTYSGSIPYLRIDHIFFSEDFKVCDHQIYLTKASDHHFVRSVVGLIQK